MRLWRVCDPFRNKGCPLIFLTSWSVGSIEYEGEIYSEWRRCWVFFNDFYYRCSSAAGGTMLRRFFLFFLLFLWDLFAKTSSRKLLGFFGA